MRTLPGVQAAGFRLGIDFGTSHTVAVLRWPDGRARPLLFDGSPLLPSAVYAEPDGRLVVGRDALHSARLDPSRFELSPKRRIDDGWVLLGDREVPVTELIGAVLGFVAEEARRTAGGAPSAVTITCPAAWGAPRRKVLGAAASRAGLGEVRLVDEPVAAATYFARVLGRGMGVGAVVLVYDFGGGTFDVSIVERTADGFRVVAVDGRDDIGGLDLDEALVTHLGGVYAPTDPDAWRRLTEPGTTEDRRQRRLFWDDVRGVKERLSRQSSAELHVPVLERDVHLTREEFEELARPLIEETVRLTAAVIRQSGTPRERIVGIFLVGGSSRIPLVSTQIQRAMEIAPTVIEQPELVVAEGSVLALGAHVGAGPETMVATARAPGSTPSTPMPVSGVPVSGPPYLAGPVSGPPYVGAPVSGPPLTPLPVSVVPVSRPTSPPPVAGGYRSGSAPLPQYPLNTPVPVAPAPRPGAAVAYRGGRQSGGGRRALRTLLVLLLVGSLAGAGYVAWQRFGPQSGPATPDPASTATADLLYDGAPDSAVLVARSGEHATLSAGTAVSFVIGVRNGWIVGRATAAKGVYLTQQVDLQGTLLREVANTTGVFVNNAGTRVAVITTDSKATAWDPGAPNQTLRTTTLPSGVKGGGWVGTMLLLRLSTDNAPYYAYDYWDPGQGGYQPTPSTAGLYPLGDSGDGKTLVALTKGPGGVACLTYAQVLNKFQTTGTPRCDTGLTLINPVANTDDVLPVLSPDGTTLVGRRGSDVVAYPVEAGGTEAHLTGLPDSSITRVSWAAGVLFVQTASGAFYHCLLAGGSCSEFTPAAVDGIPVTRIVVRFPAG